MHNNQQTRQKKNRVRENPCLCVKRSKRTSKTRPETTATMAPRAPNASRESLLKPDGPQLLLLAVSPTVGRVPLTLSPLIDRRRAHYPSCLTAVTATVIPRPGQLAVTPCPHRSPDDLLKEFRTRDARFRSGFRKNRCLFFDRNFAKLL